MSCRHEMSVRPPVIKNLITEKSMSSKLSISRVSFISPCLIFKSKWLEADQGGVLLVFPVKSIRSGFRTIPLGPIPDEPVINHTAISTCGVTTLFNAVNFSSCMRFSIAKTALLTAFLILLSVLLPMTWFWLALSTILSKCSWWPLAFDSLILWKLKSKKVLQNNRKLSFYWFYEFCGWKKIHNFCCSKMGWRAVIYLALSQVSYMKKIYL